MQAPGRNSSNIFCKAGADNLLNYGVTAGLTYSIYPVLETPVDLTRGERSKISKKWESSLPFIDLMLRAHRSDLINTYIKKMLIH